MVENKGVKGSAQTTTVVINPHFIQRSKRLPKDGFGLVINVSCGGYPYRFTHQRHPKFIINRLGDEVLSGFDVGLGGGQSLVIGEYQRLFGVGQDGEHTFAL